jgi:hypothetical protein
LSSLELRLFDSLGSREKTQETLIRESGLSNREFAMALGGLRMANLVSPGKDIGWKRS